MCTGGYRCGGRGKETGVDCDGTEFIFEEAEAGFWWGRELREEVEEEGGFAGTEEPGEDGDRDGGRGSHGETACDWGGAGVDGDLQRLGCLRDKSCSR